MTTATPSLSEKIRTQLNQPVIDADGHTIEYGVRLQAISCSDVGHWDVPDIGQVLAEAYELVEEGFLNEDDFRDFVFGHSARLYSHLDRDFFAGAAIAIATQKAG